MKKKPLKLRLPYFFGKGNHGADSSGSGNMPELIKPESEWQRAESVIEDILRWADDGGNTLDTGNRTTRPEPDAAQEQSNTSEHQRTGEVSGNTGPTSDGS